MSKDTKQTKIRSSERTDFRLAPPALLEPTTRTLAVPESCFLLGAQATFDRGANPPFLFRPPDAVGLAQDNSRAHIVFANCLGKHNL